MMPRRVALYAATVLLPLTCVPFGIAQTGAPKPAGGDKPRARIVRAAGPIHIDGRLDEPDWARSDVIKDFRDEEPNEGAPATEKTEVRVLFDAKNLYIGVQAYDSEPSKITARELLRDADFDNDDKVEVLIDTFHDRRNAYRFAVNPLGVQQDALVTDEGRDINVSWDANWISKAIRGPSGWTVEIAIPLMTLRFKEHLGTWGFNVARQIRRKHEETLWTSWQREYGLERVSQAGELDGVGDIRRRRLLEIKPYVTAGWRQGVPVIGRPAFDAGIRGTAGLEVARIGITPSLTAEFTVNPDFGQAEVDSQVVNLSRFSVFFPEKRDFFLENAGIFFFGGEQTNQLFFSRRIGLTDDGDPVPINYGAKVTGTIGKYRIGFLTAETRKLGDQSTVLGVPRQRFTVFRIKRQVLGTSSVGAIFVDREGSRFAEPSALAFQTRYHRAAGIDALINFTSHLKTSAFIMATWNPLIRSSIQSARIDNTYENDKWRFNAMYEDIGSNFDPQMGFVERNGVKHYFGEALWKPRPRFIPHVRSMDIEAAFDYYADRAGKLATRGDFLTWVTTFNNGSQFYFRPIQYARDVLKDPFEIRPGIVIPPGSYPAFRPIVGFQSDSSRKVTFDGTGSWGRFYTGTLAAYEASIGYRPNMHLNINLSDELNRGIMPAGKFTTNLVGARLDYNYSRNLLTSTFVQLNSAAQLSSVNFRFRYIFRPNSDFFIIYNQNTGRGLTRPSYSLQAKVSYDFTF